MNISVKRSLAPLVRALDQVGGTSPSVVFVVFGFLAMLQFATDSLEELISSIMGPSSFNIVAPIMFVGLLILAIGLIRRCYRPRPVIEGRSGLGAHTLLLFLSPPLPTTGSGSGSNIRSECEDAVEEAKQAARAIATDPRKIWNLGKNRWRMPLEAVAAHRSTLHRVILLTSEETKDLVPYFRECVHAMGGGLERTEIISAQDFARFPGFPRFESDLEGLLDLVDSVYAEIERRGENAEKAVTDVTSGTVLCSLAGLAATQPFRRRCFQYVFAQPNQPANVRIWDVTFTLEQRHP